MMRLGSLVVAIVCGVGLIAGSLAAQEAPRKLVAPVRGDATVEITAPNTQIKGSDVITTIRVRNIAKGPIAGFKVEENWFNKNNEALSGDLYRHPRPFQVNEVLQITLTVPRSRVIGARNQYQFSHANGAIKATPVKSLDMPKPPAPPKPPK